MQETQRCRFDPSVGKFPWRAWQPTAVFLPKESHGQRSLVGCSPWGHTTERVHFHFSLSCTGEGNGNPLQCSCLDNPRDRGAWWAAVYGVAESGTTEAAEQQQQQNTVDVSSSKKLNTGVRQVSCFTEKAFFT